MDWKPEETESETTVAVEEQPVSEQKATEQPVSESPPVEEQPVESPPEPPVATRTASDDTLDQMWNIELVIRDKEAVLEELKEETKEVKKSLEESVIELRRLLQSSHEEQPLFDKPVVNNPTGDSHGGQSQVAPVTGWETESIKVLLTPAIPGMGKKKAESLLDEVPTLGDFEKLRSQVGRDADHLSKLLPKGFGEKLTDDLEERQLQFIADFQPVDSVAIPSNPPIEGEEDLTEEERQLLNRLKELATDEAGEWMDVRIDPEIWGDGFTAGNAGEEVGECLYTASTKQDDWLRGWASANSEWTEIYDGEGDGDSDSDGEPSGEPEAPVEPEQPVETEDDLADL